MSSSGPDSQIAAFAGGLALVLMKLVSIVAMLKTTDLYSRIWFGIYFVASNLGLVIKEPCYRPSCLKWLFLSCLES